MSDEAVIKALTRSATSHLIGKVMEVRKVAMPDAMKIVCSSILFKKINDPKTGLYREGPIFLYDMLAEENGWERHNILTSVKKSTF